MSEAEILMLATDPDASLRESWDALKTSIEEAGAGPMQIESMKSAYFMGAAQVWAQTHRAALNGPRPFHAAMISIYEDIKAEQGLVGRA